MTTTSRPDRGDVRPRSTVWITAALVLGAVAYLGVPLEMAFGGALERSTSYLSENAALDQPHSNVFRLADAIAGVTVAVACVLIWRRRTPAGQGRAMLATSVTALAGVTVSAVLVCASLRRQETRAVRRVRVSILVATAAVVGTALVVTAAAIVDQLAGGLPEGAGYVQRAQTVAISAYLCVLAVGVRRTWIAPAPDASPRKVSR